MDLTCSGPFSLVITIPEPFFRCVSPATCGDQIRCSTSYIFTIALWFHMLATWWIFGFGRDGAAAGMIYPIGVSQIASKKSINCQEGKLYVRASSPRRCFYSFFMLHNPRVSPCTLDCIFVHVCNLSPRYTTYSYPKLNTINLHNLIWGDQYQPSISKLPSPGPFIVENFSIFPIPFSSDCLSNFWSRNASHL